MEIRGKGGRERRRRGRTNEQKKALLSLDRTSPKAPFVIFLFLSSLFLFLFFFSVSLTRSCFFCSSLFLPFPLRRKTTKQQQQNAGKPVAAAEAKAKAAATGAKASSSSSSATAADLASDPLALWAPVAPPAEPLPFADPKQPIRPLPDSADGTECLKWDDSLWSHADHFRYRWNVFKGIRSAIDANEGGLDSFSRGYEKYGFNRGLGGEDGKQPGIWYREWAPGARAVALVGEFNSWEPGPNHWATKDEYGVWSLFLPDSPDGTSAIEHRTKVKARVETAYGEWVERIPAWIKWATQEWNEVQFNGVYYEPPRKAAPGQVPSSPDEAYQFAYPRPPKPRALRIYECHVGMSSAEPKVNSYLEFARDVLPRVRAAGYNAIQIMAIQEHAYYGSFGYHVTNFFAVRMIDLISYCFVFYRDFSLQKKKLFRFRF